MTKLFLAAGVAALAITAQASAAPGDRDSRQNRAERSNADRGDRQAQRAERPQRAERQAQRVERPQRVERQAQRVERPQRMERQAQRVERRAQRVERPQRIERQAQRVERPQRVERQAQRIETRQARVDNRGAREANRIQRAENRMAQQQMRAENRFDRQQMRAENRFERQMANANRKAFNQAVRNSNTLYNAERAATFRTARVNTLNSRYGYNFAAPVTAASLIGLPLTQANSIMSLSPVPRSISYLYPSNSMYDYRYGDGYIYQVDRTSNLIAALIPLLAGGYMPGQMLPQSYMNNYVPAYYGYNSFYPSYDNQCTRYANGVLYYVDCYTGMIDNVMPLYNSGYGVGQMLPSSYGYYNVPNQYRPYYYDTANTGYWYAPGAIYQYDPTTSLITSVAALLSPGLTVGQQLPMGYGAYNVPMGFRDTYYDSPDHWYRYSNGYIYQVDPTTQLVTALVASALT